MICPRCADEHIEVMATSPVKDVWIVYQCQHLSLIHISEPTRLSLVSRMPSSA